MKNKNWIESEDQKLSIKNEFIKEETSSAPNYYGRVYNESVSFNQSNFETFQNILDKRNELLSSVKSFNQI